LKEGWAKVLLTEALKEAPENPRLKDFAVQFLDTTQPQPLDPLDAPVVGTNLLFIDREDLRNRMRELRLNKHPHVLVIRGKRYSGKTHSRYLIDHLFDHLWQNGGGFRAVVIDLVREAITQPYHLAETIIRRINGDVNNLPPQGTDTAERWGASLVDTIEYEVRRLGLHVWMVFDNLTKEGLPTETLDWIRHLATRVELDIPELRIVLLGLQGSLPPEIDGRVLREEIRVIDEAKCIDWLQTVLKLREIPVVIEELKSAVARIFKVLPPPEDKQHLQELARHLADLLTTLLTPQTPTTAPGGET
jgi:hypothetical protein